MRPLTALITSLTRVTSMHDKVTPLPRAEPTARLKREYFRTLDMAEIRTLHHPNSEKGMAILRYALGRHHGVTTEADGIVEEWKRERGIDADSD